MQKQIGGIFVHPIRLLLLELVIVTILTIGMALCRWQIDLTGSIDFTLPWVIAVVLVHVIYPGVGVLMIVVGVVVLRELVRALKSDATAKNRLESRGSVLCYLALIALGLVYAFLRVYSIYYFGLLFMTLVSCVYILATVREITQGFLVKLIGTPFLTTLIACLPLLWFK